MTFIDNHVDPLDLTQNWSILDDILVGRQEDLELARAHIALEHTTLGGVALVRDGLNGGSPLGELSGPIGHGGQGDDDEVGSSLPFHLDQEGNERDGLDGFTETLFMKVRQNIWKLAKRCVPSRRPRYH